MPFSFPVAASVARIISFNEVLQTLFNSILAISAEESSRSMCMSSAYALPGCSECDINFEVQKNRNPTVQDIAGIEHSVAPMKPFSKDSLQIQIRQ